VTSYGYYPLPASLSFAVSDTGPKRLEMAVERASMPSAAPGDLYQSLLEVRDGAGYRRVIGVRSQGRTPTTVSGKPGGIQAAGPATGLWVGQVTLNRVSEPMRDPTVVTETPAELGFRVMFHVDDSGTVRLLNEVTQFWRPATMVPDPKNPSYDMVDQPGRYILLTPTAPASLVSEVGTTIEPAALRDGRPFARRISTVAYSLLNGDANPEEPTAALSGDFGSAGSTLDVTIVIEDTDPLNPFHHQYHPKHRYPEPGDPQLSSNDWTIEWGMNFAFTADPPDGRDTAGWGDTQVGGVYQETVTGLKSEPIIARGVFRLQRASTVAVLNDGLGS
jgi:hypothetical protein